MAKLPKNATISVSTDTDGLTKLKQIFTDIGLALGNSLPKPKPFTPEQIAHAYGVPPEMIGLLPPDAGETITQAAFDGTLTGDAYVYADGGVLKNWAPSWVLDQSIHAGGTGVLEIDECPTNTAPYVPGHLGINAMLVNQQQPVTAGWEGKTSAEIMADIQKAIDAYGKKKKDVPKKTFKAPEPGEGSGIPAHAVFTSPLIHTQAQAEETAKKLLKTTGDVKIATLDAQGNPTGGWTTIGQISDFPGLSGVMNPDDYKLAQGWPPKPQNLTLSHPAPKQPSSSFLQALTEAKLAQTVQAEHAMLGAYLGVDLSKSSGNIVTMQSNPVDPGVVQVSVYGPDDEPVTQTTIPMSDLASMADKAEKMIFIDPAQTGTPWHQDWGHTGETVAEDVQVSEDDHGVSFTGTLSNHAMGTALDFNASPLPLPSTQDHMHFEVGSMATGQPVNLGHTEVFAEALKQQQALNKLQVKVEHQKFSTTHKLAHGGTLIEYPDGMATLDLPGTVHVSGKGIYALNWKGTLPVGVARRIAGLDPVQGADILDSTMQSVYGEPYVWHPEYGWLPKAEAVSLSTAVELLFAEEIAQEPPAIHPEAHLWCTACDVHWMNHKGDPVACQSGGYLRRSTPLEDKQYVTRIQMLKDTGLAM